MSENSKNKGVRTIAQFRDRAVPLAKTPQPPAGPGTPTQPSPPRRDDSAAPPDGPSPGEGVPPGA